MWRSVVRGGVSGAALMVVVFAILSLLAPVLQQPGAEVIAAGSTTPRVQADVPVLPETDGQGRGQGRRRTDRAPQMPQPAEMSLTAPKAVPLTPAPDPGLTLTGTDSLSR